MTLLVHLDSQVVCRPVRIIRHEICNSKHYVRLCTSASVPLALAVSDSALGLMGLAWLSSGSWSTGHR